MVCESQRVFHQIAQYDAQYCFHLHPRAVPVPRSIFYFDRDPFFGLPYRNDAETSSITRVMETLRERRLALPV